MTYFKQFDNGLRVIINKMEGLYSVSFGIMVKTGSINESQEENGISHFIEHVLFKGTKTRSAFDISDRIDSVGGQINAYTSKEVTCYYTKSTKERLKDVMEVLSDIFFETLLLYQLIYRRDNSVLWKQQSYNEHYYYYLRKNNLIKLWQRYTLQAAGETSITLMS